MAMTKRERLLTAIRGGVPDVVPVSATIHWRFAQKLLGRCHWKDIIEVHDLVDAIFGWRPPISIGPNSDYDPRWGQEMRLIAEEGTERTYERIIRTAKGSLTAIHSIGFDSSDPVLGFTRKYFVTEPEQWDIVEAYWLDELEQTTLPEHEELDEARELLGDNGVAGTINNSTFSRLCLMRGMEGTLLDLLDMPERMRALMDVAHQYREREIRSFLESKGDVYTYDICWATGAGMSPQMFREWVLPDLVKVCDLVRDVPGRYLGFYTLGRIRDLLDMLVDAGPDFIATFEQNEGDLTLGEAKKRVGDRVCLIGNFDPLVLQDGTLEDARREARRCLEEGMEGGGYVMSTGDEVPPTTKLDNLKAMAEVAEECGRY